MNIEDRENKISLAEIELIYKYINHIYYTDKNIFKHITTNNNSIYNIKVYYDIDNNDIVINSMINKCKYTIANLHKYGINYDINIYNNINANDIKIIYNYISYLYKSNINNFKYIIYNDTTNNFYNIKIEYYNDNVDIDNKTILTHSINQPIQENLNTYYNKYKPNDIDSNIYKHKFYNHCGRVLYISRLLIFMKKEKKLRRITPHEFKKINLEEKCKSYNININIVEELELNKSILLSNK